MESLYVIAVQNVFAGLQKSKLTVMILVLYYWPV